MRPRNFPCRKLARQLRTQHGDVPTDLKFAKPIDNRHGRTAWVAFERDIRGKIGA